MAAAVVAAVAAAPSPAVYQVGVEEAATMQVVAADAVSSLEMPLATNR